MSVLWITGAVCIAVFAVIMLVPIPMRLDAAGSGGKVERVTLRVFGIAMRPGKPAPEGKRTRRSDSGFTFRTARSKAGRFTPLGRIMTGASGRRLGLRTLRAFRFGPSAGRLDFGFDDPASTGVFAAFAYAATPWLPPGFVIAPRFDAPVLAYDVTLRVRVNLGSLSLPLIRFLFEPGVIAALIRAGSRKAARRPQAA